jgi:hypothetical protein
VYWLAAYTCIGIPEVRVVAQQQAAGCSTPAATFAPTMPTTTVTTTSTAAGVTTTTTETTTVTEAVPSGGDTLAYYYTMTGAPNPVIVDLAAEELGVDLAPVYKEVDLLGMENRSPVRAVGVRGIGWARGEARGHIYHLMACCGEQRTRRRCLRRIQPAAYLLSS